MIMGTFLPFRLSKVFAFHCARKIGAENEIRTRDLILGKDMLYQLSYFRIFWGNELVSH